MHETRKYAVRILALLGLLVTADAASARAETLIVAHPDVALQSLNGKDLKNLFLGKTKKIEGERVVAVTLKSGDTHVDFAKNRLAKSPSQFRTHWRKLIFTGKAKMLAEIEDEAEMVKYISENEGTVGYIDSSTPHDELRVLHVVD